MKINISSSPNIYKGIIWCGKRKFHEPLFCRDLHWFSLKTNLWTTEKRLFKTGSYGWVAFKPEPEHLAAAALWESKCTLMFYLFLLFLCCVIPNLFYYFESWLLQSLHLYQWFLVDFFSVSPVIFNVSLFLSSVGGAAKCGSKFVSEGLVFHHHHSGRYSQVFLWRQCHPCGQWIPADGEPEKIHFWSFINVTLYLGKCNCSTRV